MKNLRLQRTVWIPVVGMLVAPSDSFIFGSIRSNVQPVNQKRLQTELSAVFPSLPGATTMIDLTTTTTSASLSVVLSSHHHEAPTEGLALLPAIGSSLIMFTIVALLYAWEESVEWVRESVPPALLPVVESILSEIGGLGFIGLILQTVLGSNLAKESLESVSDLFFGEGEILVENFEFLHAAFFQVGVGFFAAAGVMVAVGLQKLKEIETVEGLQFNKETGECTMTPESLSKYLKTAFVCEGGKFDPAARSSSDILRQEIFMAKEERAAKSILLRRQFMKLFPQLPETFRMESIIQASFAQNLYKMVELSPLTWIYLIPALALANAVDLSHEVINAASPNALESSGYFFSTLSVIGPSTFSVGLSAIWGVWNCWKMTQIKYMLLPTLASTTNGATEFLPAPYEDEASRQFFQSSPAWVQPIEQIWAKPAKNAFEELFGTAGGAGLKLYRNSIKYQAWLCLTHIVFFGTQIVPRDIGAVVTGAAVGDPTHLNAELVTYGGFVLLSLLQLALIAPRAFWNYCLVACIEKESGEKLLELSGVPYEEDTSAESPMMGDAISQE